MEEGDLRWLHSGGTGWDKDVQVGDHTNLSWGSDLVRFNDFLNFVDWGLGGVGEDESDLSLELILQDFQILDNLSVLSLEFSKVLSIG